MNFVSERVSKCSSIELDAPIEKVFPLFGPIREKEWAEGWSPEIIYSTTNLVEEHMIFRTRSPYAVEEYYTWTITQFNPDKHQIEYTVSTQNRIWFIRVVCVAKGEKTMAEICYTYTGLNEEGNRFNEEALKKMYTNDLRDWQGALNYYLKNGKLLTQ